MKTKTRNKKKSCNLHFPLRRNYSGSWTRITRTRTRTNTNPNDTEADAAGRSVRATKQLRPSTKVCFTHQRHQTRCCCSAYPGSSPSFFCLYSSGRECTRPAFGLNAVSELPTCTILNLNPPKYRHLADFVFNDSLFKVQHRPDYLPLWYKGG